MEQFIEFDVTLAYEHNSGAIIRVCALLLMTAEVYAQMGREDEARVMEEGASILMGVHEAITGLPDDKFQDRMMAQAYSIGRETVALSIKH